MQTWIEISRQAVIENYHTLRKLSGNTLLAPAVKGNAYGHGMLEVAKLLVSVGCPWLTVATARDVFILREAGVVVPILLVGYAGGDDWRALARSDVHPLVYTRETAEEIAKAGAEAGKVIPVHVKVDTGMGRQGVLPGDALAFISFLKTLRGIAIEGVATHYATADGPYGDEQCLSQQRIIFGLRREIERAGIRCLFFHSANSAAFLQYPETHSEMARPGIAIYGYYPSAETAAWCKAQNIVLAPSLMLKTKVAQVKELPAGHCVSYGCTFETDQPTTIAVLPIGYADGIDRKLSNNGSVLIQGRRAPVIGRVCMNIMMVDVTHIAGVSVGDEAVLIGRQGNAVVAVEEIAEALGTINYEVTTRLRESIPRRVVS